MNYKKIFQNEQAWPVSAGRSYSEDHLMHILLDNFHQGVNVLHRQQASRQSWEDKKTFTEQKISIYLSLQTDYLNLDNISGSGGNNERENLVQAKCTFCGGTNH